MDDVKIMSYNHKISDLKYRINNLISKDVCQKIINIFEKYPELYSQEWSYKYKDEEQKKDNYKCLNLSAIKNPNEDILYAFNEARKYISIMIANYVFYIRSKKISPDFNDFFMHKTNNIRILKYEVGQCITDHTDVGKNLRASCT